MEQTLFFGGRIITVDEPFSTAEAVLVDRGRILAVGGLADVRRKAAPGIVERDLAGRTMIPGFVDPHGHFPDSGFNALFKADLSPPPLGDCGDLAEVLDRLADKTRATPDGEWVLGALFDPDAIVEGRFPTRDELDGITARHPVWISHFTGHAGAANFAALVIRGVDESTPDPVGGALGRSLATGRLDGRLTGKPAMRELGENEFMMNRRRFMAAVERAGREYLSEGVTLAQNAWAPERTLSWFRDLASETGNGRIGVMVLPAGFLEPRLSRGELGFDFPKSDSVLFGPRKLFADGSLHVQTALLTTPYHVPLCSDEGRPREPAITADGLFAEFFPLNDAGFQVHIHANGDAAADIVLDVVARALDLSPRADHRHTIVHAQTLRRDQLDRMADLGVSASFFSAHIHYWGEFHRKVTLGPERAENISPARWAVESGVRFTIHNDTTVTPMLPLHLMWCAVKRETAAGRVLGRQQRISAQRALRAHTIDAAWQVFQERERGSIEAGKRADFAILSANPLDDDAAIRGISVLETIIGGTTAYSRSAGV